MRYLRISGEYLFLNERLIAENLTLLLRKIILEYLHRHKAYFATTFTTFHDLLLPYITLTPRQPNCELYITTAQPNCEF